MGKSIIEIEISNLFDCFLQARAFRPWSLARKMQDARKRLMRDMEEIKKNPLPTVTAAPLENDMFVWHANVLGMAESAYANAVFHLVRLLLGLCRLFDFH